MSESAKKDKPLPHEMTLRDAAKVLAVTKQGARKIIAANKLVPLRNIELCEGKQSPVYDRRIIMGIAATSRGINPLAPPERKRVGKQRSAYMTEKPLGNSENASEVETNTPVTTTVVTNGEKSPDAPPEVVTTQPTEIQTLRPGDGTERPEASLESTGGQYGAALARYLRANIVESRRDSEREDIPAHSKAAARLVLRAADAPDWKSAHAAILELADRMLGKSRQKVDVQIDARLQVVSVDLAAVFYSRWPDIAGEILEVLGNALTANGDGGGVR